MVEDEKGSSPSGCREPCEEYATAREDKAQRRFSQFTDRYLGYSEKYAREYTKNDEEKAAAYAGD